MSKFETKAIRTQAQRSQHNEHSVPLYLTSSFVFDSAEHGASLFKREVEGNLYSRFSNPNSSELIDKLCQMEKAEAGVTTASGMAAVYTTLVAHLQHGDHLIASRNMFGNSLYIITDILPRMGVTHTLVDVDDNEGWEQAVQPNTKLLLVETPANPTLRIADLAFLGKLCQAHDILYVVDNCFATPYLQQPTQFGADLVLHSATKYIDGQGRVLGGVIVGEESAVALCYEFLRRTGACMSPFNAWILSKSLETLGIRMDRHCSNAARIAQHLESHPAIGQVIYPHLASHIQYDLARQQMSQGGGLVGFELKDGLQKGISFLNKLKIHSLTANLGDSRSIATHPASTTHSKLKPEVQLANGITPGFVRLSVGLEHVDDLIADIDQALA